MFHVLILDVFCYFIHEVTATDAATTLRMKMIVKRMLIMSEAMAKVLSTLVAFVRSVSLLAVLTFPIG